MAQFSGAVKLADLNDFIAPSQACVVNVDGSKKATLKLDTSDFDFRPEVRVLLSAWTILYRLTCGKHASSLCPAANSTAHAGRSCATAAEVSCRVSADSCNRPGRCH